MRKVRDLNSQPLTAEERLEAYEYVLGKMKVIVQQFRSYDTYGPSMFMCHHLMGWLTTLKVSVFTENYVLIYFPELNSLRPDTHYSNGGWWPTDRVEYAHKRIEVLNKAIENIKQSL